VHGKKVMSVASATAGEVAAGGRSSLEKNGSSEKKELTDQAQMGMVGSFRRNETFAWRTG